jgi:hypothetical protein
VVVRYRVKDPGERPTIRRNKLESERVEPDQEDPSDRAFRLTEKLRGLLKEELAEYGGSEAFLRWIRSEDKDAA